MRKFNFGSWEPLVVSLFGVLAGLVNVPTASAEQAVAPQRLSTAWIEATELIDGTLTRPQQALLSQLAYHAAVANLCDGFVLDREKFAEAFTRLEHQDTLSMNADEHAYFERHLLVNFGIVTGVFMAEGSLDQTAFC